MSVVRPLYLDVPSRFVELFALFLFYCLFHCVAAFVNMMIVSSDDSLPLQFLHSIMMASIDFRAAFQQLLVSVACMIGCVQVHGRLSRVRAARGRSEHARPRVCSLYIL